MNFMQTIQRREKAFDLQMHTHRIYDLHLHCYWTGHEALQPFLMSFYKYFVLHGLHIPFHFTITLS